MKYFSIFIQKSTRSSTHHYQSMYQVSRLYLEWFWRYFADKISTITQERGIIWMRKIICVRYFYEKSVYEIPYPSMHGSNAMHKKACNIKLSKVRKGQNS